MWQLNTMIKKEADIVVPATLPDAYQFQKFIHH